MQTRNGLFGQWEKYRDLPLFHNNKKITIISHWNIGPGTIPLESFEPYGFLTDPENSKIVWDYIILEYWGKL
jgi:hypothetical protein